MKEREKQMVKGNDREKIKMLKKYRESGKE